MTPLVPAVLLILQCLLCPSMATSECPSLCECKWMNGKESVRCHQANLTAIPPRLDGGTQVLDLQRNLITHLDGDAFSAVGLVNLQKVFLVECQLTQLHRFAFRNLMNLVELDLSGNLLRTIPTHIFDSMAELRELRLSRNPVLHLDSLAFKGLSHLVRLELSDCQISHVASSAFQGLHETLEWLKIDGNQLVNVPPDSFTQFHNLHGLELTRNLWNCTCSLYPLRLWMLQQNIPYEVSPVCAQPERLRDRLWSRLEVSEFACPPNVTVSVGNKTVKAIEGQNVTIGCDIEGAYPEPSVRWLFRNRVIVGSSSPSAAAAITTLDTRRKFHHKLTQSVTQVTIAWIESHDSGVYKCVAENGAGRSEASVSVLVYSRHYLIDSNNNVVEASVALAHSNHRLLLVLGTVLAVLLGCVMMFFALFCYSVLRKKKAQTLRETRGQERMSRTRGFQYFCCHQVNESYEKIEMQSAVNPLSSTAATILNVETQCGMDKGEDEEDDNVLSIEERRRSMSLNLSQSPKTRKTSSFSCRRRNGDFYLNVPTTAEEEDLNGVHGDHMYNRPSRDSNWKREGTGELCSSRVTCNSGGNFSHPLADLCPTSSVANSTQPLINMEPASRDDPVVVSEVIRHHVLRKRHLTEEHCVSDQEMSINANPPSKALCRDDKEKEGRLSPTLKQILRNDENFDLFDVKSTLDDFYVKQLQMNYEQQSRRTDGSKLNNFCSLPRKKSAMQQNLMAFSNLPASETCREEFSDATLQDSLFNPAKDSLRPHWSSQLDLTASYDAVRGADYRQKSFTECNKATPLLNIPKRAPPTATGRKSGSAIGGDIASGIFPSNCGSPSIVPTLVATKDNKGGGKDYDYHAAQLELFLEEYKRLQQQLCKMKETCDSIRRTEELCEAAGVSRNHQLLPMSNKLLEKSHVLLESERESLQFPQRLALGQKSKPYSGRTPEPPPYWLHRNELLKGMQKQMQQNVVTGTATESPGKGSGCKSPDRVSGDGMSSGEL